MFTREELVAVIKEHKGHGSWCDGCSLQVGSLAEHLAEQIMPQGVDLLLQSRWIDVEL